ncbi:MAG: dockerin type I domain-containing protein [bacterium]
MRQGESKRKTFVRTFSLVLGFVTFIAVSGERIRLTQGSQDESTVCRGDLNHDGKITPNDALIAFRCYLLPGSCSEFVDENVDVNQDGELTPADALCLFRKFLGQPSCLENLPPSCLEEGLENQFSLTYHYTAEATYCDVKISQSELMYTYFGEIEKCRYWIAQSPCWSQEDLETVRTTLSSDEINEVISLIRQTGFMDLEGTYGGAGQGGRYYPYTLSVKLDEREKEVVYQSFPDASPRPVAFVKVENKIIELVRMKFTK